MNKKNSGCQCTPEDHCGCMDGDPCTCDEYTDVNLHCRSIHCRDITFDDDGCSCEEDFHPVLVRDYAPGFIAQAVMPDDSIDEEFNFQEYVEDSYALIFFYPNDFTFVCPSEIIAHNNRLEEFNKRNVKVIGISVDSVYAHAAWKKMPIAQGGIGDIKFPLVSDISKSISHDYGVLTDDAVALRASFLIDRDGIVRHQIVNDLPLGRDVNETLRIIDALQFYEKNGNVCPAGWHQGDESLRPTSEGVKDYLSKNADKL